MESLTYQTFCDKVYNLSPLSDSKFKGLIPVVLLVGTTGLFCETTVKTLESLEPEFSGKFNFYFIDADTQKELMEFVHITSLPALMIMDATKQTKWLLGKIESPDLLKKLLMAHLALDDEKPKEALIRA